MRFPEVTTVVGPQGHPARLRQYLRYLERLGANPKIHVGDYSNASELDRNHKLVIEPVADPVCALCH